MRKPIAPLAAVLVLGSAISGLGAPDRTDLPIHRVTLYTSGVGYFERYGQVDGDAIETLLFPVDQVNDVLKSLVLIDFDGGSVRPVTYGAQDPVSRQLQAFSIDLSDNPDRATLLNRLRGADAVLTLAGGQTVKGIVVGVETRTVALPNNGGTVTQSIVNVMGDDGLQAVRLDDVASFALTDPKLNAEIKSALAVVAGGRDVSKRPVTLGFSGHGRRSVLVGYLTATPLWQTTYRLVLGKSPILQGWALVQNTSQDDWDSVDLSLVSGRPISFVQDLYTPIYVNRPVVSTQVAQGPGPVTYNSDLLAAQRAPEDMPAPAASAASAPLAINGGGLASGLAGRVLLKDGADRRDASGLDFDKALASIRQGGGAAGAKLGTALFRYDIKLPVSVPRQQSAMIPFVSAPIQASAVSIYDASTLADHPLSGVRLKNTSGLHLMGGPITVFDQSGESAAYVGDSEMDDTDSEQTRLLSYAVDLSVDASSENGGDSGRSESVVINKGVLVETLSERSTTIYTFKNHATTARTIVVQQPYRGDGWKYVAPAGPTEHTAQTDRFDVTVAPGETKKFKVTLEQPQEQSFGLLDTDIDTLIGYSKAGTVPDDVRAALVEVVRRREAVSRIQKEIENRQSRVAQIGAGQDRIRNNMRALDHTSALYKRYVGELDTQETELQGLLSEIDRLRADEAAARQQLADYVGTLTVR